jgi:exodeoxyribonuclease-5
MSLSLSTDQADACERIREWVYARADRWSQGTKSEILTFGGLGGTGKSTILGILAEEFQKRRLLVAYATFTGRASTVLNRKLRDQGVLTNNKLLAAAGSKALEGKFAKYFLKPGEERIPFCGTLHRLLYAPMINEETEELLGWRTRPQLDRRYSLIVTDESSMIGSRMLEDIVRHGVPLLAVGDHGQLSPVQDVSTLMANPDIKLEKIHRQASDNPIIKLAHTIRETGRIDRNLAGNEIRFGKRADLGEVYRDAMTFVESKSSLDVGALCWTNKTRVQANKVIRKASGYSGPPRAGEVLICLRNAGEISNGMRGALRADAAQLGWTLDVDLDFGDEDIEEGELSLCGYQFGRERTFKDIEELQKLAPGIKRFSEAGLLFDWGSCATVHKFQGSQLHHAIGILDRPASPHDVEYRKWLYTLVTRASRRLTLLS